MERLINTIQKKINDLEIKNKELERANKEKEEIIKKCKTRMEQQSDTIHSLSRTIALQKSEIKRLSK